MIPGLGGLLRRPFTLFFIAAAFWAGTEVQLAAMKDRCLDMGGTLDARGICRGLK